MPTIFKTGPYRFFFYSGDKYEPPHIHVEHDDKKAKFWLNPVRLCKSIGFNRQELNHLQKLIDESENQILRSWDEYFND
ncbi:DUF4160 domain-containing protein [bacterium]|nr:DUF4160 domain-containing protein [bacterium]